MNNKKYVKTYIDYKFFDLPLPKLKSSYLSRKFNVINSKNVRTKPMIYLCNKSTIFDRYFIENYLSCPHVFLKDSILDNLRNNELDKDTIKELIESTEDLRQAMISIVIFPEKQQSIFGEYEDIDKNITSFLKQTKYNIQFIELIGTFFEYPIWSSTIRKCNAKIAEKYIIFNETFSNLSDDDAFDVINNHLPSSASTYAEKHPLEMSSDKKAENLEQIMYCCPRCNAFFSLYSQFNCLRCQNCDSAIEISKDGKLLFSKNVENLDEMREYQFKILKSTDFTINPLVDYENISYFDFVKGKFKESMKVNIEIYADKIHIFNAITDNTLNYSQIKDFVLKQNNAIIIKPKDNFTFALQGKNAENLYILIDLLKLQK